MVLAGKSFVYSETFWAATGVVATVTLGLLAVWITWIIANPPQRLAYEMTAETQLLNGTAASSVREGLEIRRDGRLLSDPRVLEIKLINEGRRDIPSSAFDRERPLVLDVGVPILELLVASTEPGYSEPAVVRNGSQLRIGPDLIARGQRTTFSLLIDGGEPT
ncbi:hypothetical protein [Actinomadura sp. DC4]|uniref:hypothetical protein n=1 Tax=Actinomadura sp. DC4 TaxID=3055069 RepID=UPI0025B26FAF|nr:hypothetical protein [Actinomadura sp. DC4]MDN3356852.1 hypothetical protein [Actinomadura sp. DC4]